MRRASRAARLSVTVAAATVALAVAAPGSAQASPRPPAPATRPAAAAPAGGRLCPPGAVPVGFSDGLDKKTVGGVEIGGLSGLVYDARAHRYAAVVDNDGANPARLWFFRDVLHPVVSGTLVLRRPDGTPYNGNDSDNEGLTVLPDGDYLVSSETEPSIRIFGRDGVQRGSLAVPARFRVAPAGEGAGNATLEGLTISPSGRYVYAAMEAPLSGDAPATGESLRHRILVYERHGSRYLLARQLGYATDPGMRISEVAAYADGHFTVLEAAYSAAIGNTIRVYAVPGAGRARDVSRVGNLSAAPATDIVGKRLVTDLTRCPSLGATAKETQANPLMDNYEAMSVRSARLGPLTLGTITVLSDDNFGATQTTRLLTVAALLP